MRKKDETLREALLGHARKIADEKGPQAISIRALAGQAGIATGTVYNYFASKDDILLALTEEYWCKTLLEMRDKIHGGSFPAQLGKIYAFLQEKIADSAGVLMGSLANVEAAGRQRMQAMQQVLRTEILEQLRKDKQIKPGIWNNGLDEDRFAGFVVMNLMTLLRTNAPDADFFIEIVKRILY